MKAIELFFRERFMWIILCVSPLFLAMNSYAQSNQLTEALSRVAHQKLIVLDENQNILISNSQSIDLPQDELLVLKLWATPSTGYQWDIAKYDPDLVEILEVPIYEATGKPNVPGAPVWQYIILKSKGNGLSEMELAYQRPWDPENSREDLLKVQVKSNGLSVVNWDYSPESLTYQTLRQDEYRVRSLPAYFDWRDQNAVTPVRDQGSCGSCWAFGSTAGFEAKIQMKHGTMPDLAEQYLVSCNEKGYNCGGGWWAHELWAQHIPPGQDGAGAVYETDFPYQAMDVDCKVVDHFEQIEGWAYTDDVPDNSTPTKLHDPTVAQIKQKLHQWGPIPTALCTDNWGGYTGGVLEGSSNQYTTHIVLITGWDDNNQCWIIKNSWGSDWGEDGYIRIRYGSHLSGQYSTYLKYDKTNPRLVYQGSQFYEGIPNDGSIRKPITAKLLDAGNGFALVNVVLTPGIHYQVQDLPAGLSLEVRTLSAEKVKFTLSGEATNHLDANDVLFNIQLLDPVFASFSSSEVEASSYGFDIDFFNPYEIVYDDIQDYTVNTSNTWEFFRIANGQSFGLWYSFYYDPYPTKVMTFFLETYTKKAICNTAGFGEADRMLTPLSYGDIIDGQVNYFVTGGSYGDQHRITNSKFTDWNGRTAYVGIQFPMYGGICYGWMRIQVSSGGSEVRILDYAYNEKPFAPIKAGFKAYEAIEPIANFDAEPLISFVGQEVFFTDRSERDPETWSWTFEGANPATSTDINPSVIYNAPGVYSVQLEVSNVGGSSSITKDDYIQIYPADPPIADFSVDALVPEGATVDFTDLSNNLPTSWLWEFEGGDPATSQEQNPTVIYPNPGSYKVKLTATNDFGGNVIEKQACVQVQAIAQSYCEASTEMPDSYHILGVSLANLNSSSEAGANGYENHLNEYASLDLGNSYPISVNVKNSQWDLNALGIWVDWNQDGDFIDAQETVFTMNGTQVYEATLDVPENAVQGITRMRVRIHYSKAPYPCGIDTYQGEVEDYSLVIGLPEIDNENPSVPQNLVAEVNALKVQLNWSNSTDNVGVSRYRIFANGNELGQSVSSNYQTSNLIPETIYTFKVLAEDASGNQSAYSNEVTVETEDEEIVIPPLEYCEAYNANDQNFYIQGVQLADLDHSSSKSGQGYQDFTQYMAHLTPGETYQIDVDVMNDHWPYNALGIWIDWNRDGDYDDDSETILSMKSQGIYATSFTVPAWVNVQNTQMRLRIHYDKTPFACGYDNYQGEVEDYTISLGGTVDDNEDPSTPENLEGSVNQQDISLNWDASTDDVGIAKYLVFMENELVQEVITTTCMISALAPNTIYSFQVQAVDVVGKKSELSGGIRLTTADNAVNYCAAMATSGPEHINNVQFGDLSHSSALSQYSDFTNYTANVARGQYQLLEVGLGEYYSNDRVSAWFDWNSDGDFDDSGEHYNLIIHTTELAYQWIMVPQDAVNNSIRMRIRMHYYTSNDKACGENNYGEVEDYQVQVARNGMSGIQDVSEITSHVFEIYPNPNEGQFEIKLQMQQAMNTYFMVYDMYGSVVYSVKEPLPIGKFNKDFDMKLVPGIYTLRILNADMDKRKTFIAK